MSQKKSFETTPDKQKNKRSAMVSHRMQQEVSKVRSKVQNYSDDGHEYLAFFNKKSPDSDKRKSSVEIWEP